MLWLRPCAKPYLIMSLFYFDTAIKLIMTRSCDIWNHHMTHPAASTLLTQSEPAWQKMARSPLNGTTQTVDIKERGLSSTMDSKYWEGKCVSYFHIPAEWTSAFRITSSTCGRRTLSVFWKAFAELNASSKPSASWRILVNWSSMSNAFVYHSPIFPCMEESNYLLSFFRFILRWIPLLPLICYV